MGALLEDITVLERFDTPTICNALELIDSSRRDSGYTRFNMTAVNAAVGPVAGFALTATMRSEKPSELSANELKQARLDYYAYMFTDMGGPKICVMHDADDPDAVHGPFWGEFNTRIHRAMGFRGVVTDGCVRDLRKLPTDVLLLARGLRPSHANMHIVSYGEPVQVYGMDVSHGDVVHADEHGAVAFPAKLVDDIAARAKEFIDREAPIMAACNEGGLTLPKLRSLYLARKKLPDRIVPSGLRSPPRTGESRPRRGALRRPRRALRSPVRARYAAGDLNVAVPVGLADGRRDPRPTNKIIEPGTRPVPAIDPLILQTTAHTYH